MVAMVTRKGLYITKIYFLIDYAIVSRHAKFQSHSCFLRDFMEGGRIAPPPPLTEFKKPTPNTVNQGVLVACARSWGPFLVFGGLEHVN